jgi:hypothetical protein
MEDGNKTKQQKHPQTRGVRRPRQKEDPRIDKGASAIVAGTSLQKTPFVFDLQLA